MTIYCGVMSSMLTSSVVVDCGFDQWLGQTKDYKSGTCCFSALQHTVLRSKSKDQKNKKVLA
jgi:hypothetical protein